MFCFFVWRKVQTWWRSIWERSGVWDRGWRTPSISGSSWRRSWPEPLVTKVPEPFMLSRTIYPVRDEPLSSLQVLPPTSTSKVWTLSGSCPVRSGFWRRRTLVCRTNWSWQLEVEITPINSVSGEYVENVDQKSVVPAESGKELEHLREAALLERARLKQAELEGERWAEQGRKLQAEVEAHNQKITQLNQDRQRKQEAINRWGQRWPFVMLRYTKLSSLSYQAEQRVQVSAQWKAACWGAMWQWQSSVILQMLWTVLTGCSTRWASSSSSSGRAAVWSSPFSVNCVCLVSRKQLSPVVALPPSTPESCMSSWRSSWTDRRTCSLGPGGSSSTVSAPHAPSRQMTKAKLLKQVLVHR